MLWLKRLICEHFGCAKPKDMLYKVTQEDDHAACVKWTCPRCGEVASALHLKSSFTRELAEHTQKIRQQQEIEPLDGEVTEIATPRLR